LEHIQKAEYRLIHIIGPFNIRKIRSLINDVHFRKPFFNHEQERDGAYLELSKGTIDGSKRLRISFSEYNTGVSKMICLNKSQNSRRSSVNSF
jgi:hypothetical protein